MTHATRAATVAELAWFFKERKPLVLTGAGISTDSGIPDYRGPQGSLRKRSPVTYSEFLRDSAARQRYWARSAIGWPIISSVQPNESHRIVGRLEGAGLITGVVTQNVDGLHYAAGSRNVVELHGTLSRVVCLDCGSVESRESLQTRMLAENPDWDRWQAEEAPDGDAELPSTITARFQVPRCTSCGGLLKPDVVFFGENVPATRVEEVFGMVEGAAGVLVLGSSLTVYSGYRFVERASRLGRPVGIVNLGPTRADPLATLRIDAPLGEVLGVVADSLGLS